MGGENNKKNNEDGGGGEGKKNTTSSVTVVLKTNLHCDGCASKFLKTIRSIDGVDTVTAGDGQKITVVGKVDPANLREKVEQKTHKKVELVSPQPKKDAGAGNKEKKNEPKDKADSTDKSDQKKPNEKQLPVTTAVFKVALHCDGCIHKIYKTVTKTKGYEDMMIDKHKDLVTVTGAVDAKALAEVLSKQLKRDVGIVPAKKDDGGEKKDKDGGGKSNADEKKEGNNNNNYMMPAYPYMPAAVGEQMNYNPYPVFPNHAPQIFSDENPNACSVM